MFLTPLITEHSVYSLVMVKSTIVHGYVACKAQESEQVRRESQTLNQNELN